MNELGPTAALLARVCRGLDIAARADRWLVAVAGCGLAVLVIVNVSLGQGFGARCEECWLVPTWVAVYTFQGGGPYGDFSQDVLGARRMLDGREAYPIYGPALAEIGLADQQIPHAPAHPPTAFLFGLPFAHLPWSEAARRWAIWTMAAIIVSWRAAGLGWSAAFALAGWGLLWPPLASPAPARQGRRPGYPMSSVACCRTDWGMVSPRTRAVLRLTRRSNLVGCSTGEFRGRGALEDLVDVAGARGVARATR